MSRPITVPWFHTHPFNWLGAVVVNARQCKTGKVPDQLHIFLFIKLNVQAHTCILVNFFLYSHQNATNSLKIWGSQNTSVKLSLDLFTVILMVVVEQLNLHFGYSVTLLVHILPQGKPELTKVLMCLVKLLNNVNWLTSLSSQC